MSALHTDEGFTVTLFSVKVVSAPGAHRLSLKFVLALSLSGGLSAGHLVAAHLHMLEYTVIVTFVKSHFVGCGKVFRDHLPIYVKLYTVLYPFWL